MALPAVASSATFTVTKTADTADGTCDADCSLREAVIEANASEGNDTIVLPAGNYGLTIAGVDEDAAATGDLDIDSSGDEVRIQGAGRNATIIDGNENDRIFDVLLNARLELRDLTVTDGDPRTSALAADRHGGALRTHNGRILLSRVTFSGNTAARGGGIHQFGPGNPRITGDQVTFSDNFAAGDGIATGLGGAIFNDSPADDSGDGQVVLTNSEFSGNSTSGLGGRGGAIWSSDTGHVSIADTRFSQNSAEGGGGGAIYNESNSTLMVQDSRFTGNRSVNGDGGAVGNEDDANTTLIRTQVRDSEARRGGALFNQNHGHFSVVDSVIQDAEATLDGGIMFVQNDSTTSFSRSVITGGRAAERGGGIYLNNTAILTLLDSSVTGNQNLSAVDSHQGGGLSLVNSATANIHRSTISGNSSQAGGGGIGTAGSSADVVIRLVNSTLSGNSAATTGGGLQVRGGATAELELSTIADNSAASGGGIYREGVGSEVRFSGVLLSGNTAPSGPNCDGSVFSAGFNLDSGTGCGFNAAGDIQNGSAELGPLTDNGGPTETHMVGPSGDGVDSAGSCDREIDQRGVARPQGTSCDIGSLEQSKGDLPDRSVDGIFFKAKPRQEQKGNQIRISLRAGAGEKVSIVARGRIRIKGSKRTFVLKPARATLPAGSFRNFSLKLRNRNQEKQVVRLLSGKKRVSAQLSVRLTDTVGNRADRKTTIRLTPARGRR